MNCLIPVRRREDILPRYQATPIGDLLSYHNLRSAGDDYQKAQIVIGMCMDNRKSLHLPDNFAYILRTGGANLRRIEFKVSYAIAVGKVRHLCLIGHDQCGMVNLRSRREVFVKGLVQNGGWDRQAAENHFDDHASEFEVDNSADFVISEAGRLRLRYPRVVVAPLFYKIQDGLLYQLADNI